MKKLGKIALRVLVPGLLTLTAASAAHAADIRPGLWEFRSTRMNLAGLPDLSPQMAQLQQHLKNLPADTRRLLEQQMASRGVTLGSDGTVRSCITPEQAKQDNLYSGKAEGNCVLTDVVKGRGTVRGRLNCTQPKGSGDFEASIASPEAFTTRVNVRSDRGDMQMETEARWIGEHCPAPQAAAR
ncbi:MAG: DUF3617 domain-containing protein [Proteobacteria bacterium]|nr:DUF3617 domain-containing protein [Pseudomonadota bacterium]